MDIEYQLVPPSNHRENNANRDIHTSKKNFIMGLYSVDKDSHFQMWDRLPEQAKISLNFLRQSIIIPHLSAYTHIFGKFDYNPLTVIPTRDNNSNSQ